MLLHGRFCVNLATVRERTASSRTRSQMAQSKLCTPRPRCLCSCGSGEATIRSVASWSGKRRALSVFIHCSAQEYNTSSTSVSNAIYKTNSIKIKMFSREPSCVNSAPICFPHRSSTCEVSKIDCSHRLRPGYSSNYFIPGCQGHEKLPQAVK